MHWIAVITNNAILENNKLKINLGYTLSTFKNRSRAK